MFFHYLLPHRKYLPENDQDFFLIKSVVPITSRCAFFSNVFVFVSIFELGNPEYVSLPKI